MLVTIDENSETEKKKKSPNAQPMNVEVYLYRPGKLAPLPEGFPVPQPSKNFHGIHFYVRESITNLLGGFTKSLPILSQLPVEFFIVKELTKRPRITKKKFPNGQTLSSKDDWYLHILLRLWINFEEGVALLPKYLNVPPDGGRDAKGNPNVGSKVLLNHYWKDFSDDESEEKWCEHLQIAMTRAILPKDDPEQFLLIRLVAPLERHVLGPCEYIFFFVFYPALYFVIYGMIAYMFIGDELVRCD